MVRFVDSASTDGSAAVASGLGADVVRAPLGKGAAVAAAVESCETRWLCTLDADLLWSERNLAAVLRDAAVKEVGDMVVGSFGHNRRTLVTHAIYEPLVAALFGEVPGVGTPLSGYRVWDVSLDLGELPRGYGVEVHSHVAAAVGGARVAWVDIGEYRGPLRGYRNIPAIARDVASALLDLGERCGRLRGGRAVWEEWVAEVLRAIGPAPGEHIEDPAYVAAVFAAGERPLP